MFIRDTVVEDLFAVYRKMKNTGIFVSVVMIVLGLVMFFLPSDANAAAMWLMVISLLLMGIFDIMTFCKMPAGAKDGWTLATGIIWTVIALYWIIGGLSGDAADKMITYGAFELSIAFMVGIASIFIGVANLCAGFMIKKGTGIRTLGLIICGILGIVAGVLVLTYPIGSVITLTVFCGLFLLINGIALLVRSLTL